MSSSNKNLSKESCEACSAGAVRLTTVEENLLLQNLPLWDINTQQGIPQISRVYAFDDFQQALKFANQVGWKKCEFIWAYSFMKFAQNNHPTRLFGPTLFFGT